MLSNTKPKKSLGQHFLKNQGVLVDMVAAAEISRGDTVLEIGPGRGALTDHLVATGARIIAVEKDDALAAMLRQKYLNHENIEIINEDILNFKPLNFLRCENLKKA